MLTAIGIDGCLPIQLAHFCTKLEIDVTNNQKNKHKITGQKRRWKRIARSKLIFLSFEF